MSRDASRLQPSSAAPLGAVRIVLAAVICDYVGVGMMRVTLPFYAKALGGSGTFIGALEAAYGVGQVVGALVLPRLSDTWGRRNVLLTSFAGSAIGYAVAIAARAWSSPALLLLSRLPVGLAKQTVTVSRAVVADCTTSGPDRSQWMSWLGTAIGVGYSLGPFLGGQLAEGAGDAAPAIVATAIFAVLFPVMWLLLPETAPTVASTGASSASRKACPDEAQDQVAALWRSPQIWTVLMVLALPELGLVAHTSVTLYTFALQRLGKGSAWLGNITSLTALLQAALSGTLMPVLTAKGWSDVRLLELGSAFFALASAGIAGWPSESAVMCSMLPVAVAIAVLRSFPATFLSKCVPEERQGEAMGLLDLCSSGLRVTAPVLAGACIDAFGDASVFGAQSALFLGGIAGLLLLPAATTAGSKISALGKAAKVE